MHKSCYLCGATDKPLTADHIIPKVLFPEPRPSNLITVRACAPCNNGMSKDDALLAVYLSAVLGGNAAAKWVWTNKAVNLLAKSKPLATQLVNDTTKKEVLTSLGVTTMVDVLKIPDARLNNVLRRLAKGLIRHFRPAIDYTNYAFTVDRIHPTTETAQTLQEYAGKLDSLLLGDGVFRCFYGFTEGAPSHAFFIFIFYDSVGFMVAAQPTAS